MLNGFYSGFDMEYFNRGEDKKTKGRIPFEQDRDRIIYSPAFRRLQAKTQVFLSGEYDFYRTRLTHSIEVSQIGRSICNHLNRNSDDLDPDFRIDQSLVEAICLAHDIGHPSFGHAGESVLNELMAEWGGFEGNAQNLRIIVDRFYRKGAEWSGMKPTRAFLDGILKYKVLHSGSEKKRNHFIYDEQHEVLEFVSPDAAFDRTLPDELTINNFKSLECRIMDWADDIAYSIHDLEDGIRAGFINVKKIRAWLPTKKGEYTGHDERFVNGLCEAMVKDEFSAFLARLIGAFVRATTLVRRDNFLSEQTNRYAFDISVDPEAAKLCNLLKSMAVALVFRTPQVHQLEYKGREILRKVFEVLKEQYVDLDKPRFELLPAHYATAMARVNEHDRLRIICDYISGMTDGYVIRTYKRLFDPSFGSINDLF